MVAPHPTRKELEAPDCVKTEWANGNKSLMADTLQRVNWDKDSTTYKCCGCMCQFRFFLYGLLMMSRPNFLS